MNIMKTHIKLVIAFFLIVMILMLAVFQMDKIVRKNIAKHDLQGLTEQIASILQAGLSQVNADILYLSFQSNAKEVLLGQSSADLNYLSNEYTTFSNLNKRYSQIRLMDLVGNEVFRIDQLDGEAVRISSESLQNKANRYYFKEAKKLKNGEVYQSPFDLNVEHGAVETPYRPTIRFVTPISDFNKNIIGYLILNLDATKILNRIYQSVKGKLGAFSIVNQSGDYLLSDNPEQNWGFMFNKPEYTLARQNPDIWKRVKGQSVEKQFTIDDKFYTFLEVCGGYLCHEVTEELELRADAMDMPWIIIGELDESQMIGVLWWQNVWPYVITILLTMLALITLRISSRLSNSIDLLRNRERLLERTNFRFEKLLESVPEGLVVVNSHGDIETLNSMAENIFERTKKEVIGQPIEIFMTGEFKEGHRAKTEAFFIQPRKIEATRDHPFEYITPNGLKKYLEVVIDPVIFEDEKLAIVLARDVTRNLEMQDQIRQSQKLEAVGQLTGGVAHDLNNLLGIMVGNLELLELSTAQDEKLLMRISKVMKAVNSASELTQKLLAISRKKPLEVEKINVSELMSDVLDMLHRTIKSKINIHYQAASNLPIILVDPNELTNALINLTVNARDAMPDGGDFFINVETVYLDEKYTNSIVDTIEPGNYLLVDVTDTGTGIKKDIIDKILEPFFTTKEKGKGTGLGLAMIYGFIKQSKGHMRIYSEEGHGTSVHMYLPIQDSELIDTVNEDLVEKQKRYDLSQYRVLIVDDEPDLAEVVQAYLALEGVECDIAYSGDQAWLKLMQEPYDLVFSDIVMPGEIDGLALYHKIKEAQLPVRVILSSGFSEEMLKNQHKADEQFIFVRKPYKRSQVIASIIKSLGLKEEA